MRIARLTLLTIVTLFFIIAPFSLAQSGYKITKHTYKKLLNRALERVYRQIPEDARKKIEFGVNLFIAHEVWIGHIPEEALIKAVDAFKEAGVNRVDINPGQYPWLDRDEIAIAKYDAAIERIRQHNMKLILNPQYSSFVHKVNSFEEWKSRALKIYAELAERYHPHTFVVLHEPSTMADRIGKKVKMEDWVNFVSDAARIVKEKSPVTRIGAGCLASEWDYFDAFVRMPEVEVLTLDIYTIRNLNVYNKMIRASKAAYKPVYIEETWRPPYFELQSGVNPDIASLKNIGNKEFTELDIKWLKVMTAYAQANGLEAITPTWMFALFCYVDGNGNLDDPNYNLEVVKAITRGERTATFHTLKKLVNENKSFK